MKPVKITSIYGKTMEFSNSIEGDGRIQMTMRDHGGEFVRNAIFDASQIAVLHSALAGPVVPVSKPEAGVFFLLRQKNSNPSKIRACFAPDSGEIHDPKNKEYHSRRKAELARDNQNARYGHEWTYFVVEKEVK